MSVVVLEKENETLRRRNTELEKQVERVPKLEARIAHLEEELRLALYRQFGRTSEKLVGQADLPFEDLKENETPESVEATAVGAYERRRKAGRKPLADSLPRVEHYQDLDEAEKTCACGHKLIKIGEDVSEKLAMVPAQIWVDRHHKAKYACKHCQGLSDETKPAVRTAAGEPDLIPRSIVSAELLAHIWTAKFCDHLPFYRQEAGFARIGAEISRQDMVNWTMKVALMFTPLIDLIEKAIRAGPVIQMDETPVKVLKLERTGTHGQGWMWLALGGTKDQKAVRYRFAPGRGNEHAAAFLDDFCEYLQSDAHGAYNVVVRNSRIIHVGCWAHARRKFMDAEKAAPSNLTKDALGRIRKLYDLEKQCRQEAKDQKLTDEVFLDRRKALVGPYLTGLRTWLDQIAAETLPSGLAGKALAYTVGQWEKLVRFLDHPWLTPDNNAAENAIRPFVVGRKNWLFHGNDAGAEASCRVFTLIETAKLNGLEPYKYLRQLLTKLPEVRKSGDWENLLPWKIYTGES